MSKPIPSKPVSFSGVKPSGQPTLGNYLGAFLPFTTFQQDYNVFFMIADHHAITVRQKPEDLRENTLAIAAWYIASGLNPKMCTLFVQSHVRAHVELGWILNTFTQVGELERMTQYKDKIAKGENANNAGLFTYPVLMAADILLYNTEVVPVGDDQTQHLEITRDIATRFNNIYGPTLTVPKAVKPRAAQRVRDLQDPTKKMSKSEAGAGTIMLLDSPADAAKKIMRAQTDSLGKVHYDPTNQPGISNLLEILGAVSGRTPQMVAGEFKDLQYGDFKKAVAEAVVFAMEPLQTRYAELMNDKAEILNILKNGADKANEVAGVTLEKVMHQVGYVRP